jgi:hypothetical protein
MSAEDFLSIMNSFCHKVGTENLIPWSKVFRDKFIVPQPVQKFLTVHVTVRLVAMLTADHCGPKRNQHPSL